MQEGDYRKGGGQKWQRWKQQKQIQDMSSNKGRILGDFAQNLVKKLNQPVANDRVVEELKSTNECLVCMQMMVLPFKPMMLVPCGHNMCQRCLKNLQRTNDLNKCPLCKTKVQTFSPNYSLMSLIQKFKEDQTKKSRKPQNTSQKNPQISPDLSLLRLRCSILQKQKEQLRKTLIKQNRQVEILEGVVKKLFQQKLRIKQQRATLDAQQALVDQHMKQHQHKLKMARATAQSLAEKHTVLQKSLQPLLLEKQKTQLLQAEQLIKNYD